jgi:hypothetical protein
VHLEVEVLGGEVGEAQGGGLVGDAEGVAEVLHGDVPVGLGRLTIGRPWEHAEGDGCGDLEVTPVFHSRGLFPQAAGGWG